MVLDAATLNKTAEIAVPDFPRSLALGGEGLFVASVWGKSLTALNLAKVGNLRKVSLPYVPQHVETLDDGKTVAVWPMFATLDPGTLDAHPADRLQYPLRTRCIRAGRIDITGRYDGYRCFALVKEHGLRTWYTLLPKMERFDVTIDT